MRIAARLALMIAAAALGGCGFHLKGSQVKSPELQRMYVTVHTPYETVQSTLERELKERLAGRGVTLLDSADSTAGTLTVYRLQERRRTQSVGGDGKAIEYQLVTNIEFDYRVGDTLYVPRQPLSVQRDYTFDETQVLAKENESDKLRREMQRDLADLILLRIDAAIRTGAGAPTS